MKGVPQVSDARDVAVGCTTSFVDLRLLRRGALWREDGVGLEGDGVVWRELNDAQRG